MNRNNSFAIISIILTVFVMACSTPRTKESDKILTLTIDKKDFPDGHYQRLVEALVKNGNFRVIVSDSGFRSVSTGGLLKGSVQCATRNSFWKSQPHMTCLQVLSLVSVNTSEVIVSVSAESDSLEAFYGELKIYPDFTDAADKLWSAYPKTFEDKSKTIVTESPQEKQPARMPASTETNSESE